MVRKILFGVAVLAAVAIALIFLAPRLIATDDLKDWALAQLEAATGYRVRVGGPVRIAIFPSLDLVARDVGIAQSEGDRAVEFVTASALRLNLPLGSLLSGKLKMTEMTLISPRIELPLPSRRRAAGGAGSAKETPDDTLRNLTLSQADLALI